MLERNCGLGCVVNALAKQSDKQERLGESSLGTLSLKRNPWQLTLGVLFACAATAQWLYSKAPDGHISIVGLFKQHALGAVLLFVVISALAYAALCLLFRYVDRVAFAKPLSSSDGESSVGIFTWRVWAKFAGPIALCWMVYAIACHPAITRGFDYFWQLLQGLGILPLSNHHPVFSSYVFGFIFSVGYSIGGAQFGLFLTMLVQLAFMVFVLCFCFACLRGIGVHGGVLAALCAIVCLNPVFSTHTLWLIKDSFFSSLCILLFFQAFLYVWFGAHGKKRPWYASAPTIAIVAVLFALFRNGVMPIAIILILVLFVLEFRRTRGTKGETGSGRPSGGRSASIVGQWGLAAILFAVLMGGWNAYLAVQDVYPTNVREGLTMPLRQILSTVRDHPSALSADDRNVLESAYKDKIANGGTLEDIVRRMNDHKGDSIKPSYIEDNQTLINLMGLWIRLGSKHPDCYLDTALQSTDGYWWFDVVPAIRENIVELEGAESDFANDERAKMPFIDYQEYVVRSIEHAKMDTNQSVATFCEANPMLDDIMHVESSFPAARNALRNVFDRVEESPLTSWAIVPAAYFWLTLIAFCYLFSRRQIGRCCWPILLIWALAFLSPVNGYTRYVFAGEVFSLLLVALCFQPRPEDNHG